MKLPEKSEKGAHAELEMTINKKRVVKNEAIKGEVNLVVKEGLHDCTLTITFLAQECSEINKGGLTNGSVDVIPPEEITPIKNADCQAGATYKHEYKFTLPEQPPASFAVEYPDARGCIFYMVLVTFSAGGRENLVTWRKVGVRETFPKEEMANQKDEGDIAGYCCNTKGHLMVAGMIESLATITRVNSTVSGKVEVDNGSCPYAITNLNARLFQRVHIRAKGRTEMKEDTILEWDLGSVEASKIVNIPFKIEIPYNQKFKTLASSTTGKLMRREYYININPKYDTGSCGLPKLNIRVAIENLKTYKEKDQPKAA